jgi:hypothetical protein
MMHVLKNISRKILKITAWTVAIIILLLVTAILLIQVPSIQTKIVQKTITYLKDKTHAEIDLKKIGISFPKSVYLEGLLIKDLKKDTLLYAGTATVNLDMMGLINSKIYFKSIGLSDIVAKINRAENDTLFNYNFLITAFSDTTKVVAAKKSSDKKTNLAIDVVELQKIRLIYDDNYSGMYAAANFQQLQLTMDKLDIDQQIYKINSLAINGFTGKVMLRKETATKPPDQIVVQLPVITAGKVIIKNTNFTYTDVIASQSVIAYIADFNLNKTSVDLNSEHIVLDNLSLSKSNVLMNSFDRPKIKADSLAPTPNEKNKWNVTINEIHLNDNQIGYNIINKPTIKAAFDASHINYQSVSLSAKQVFYSTDTTRADILSFSAIDSTNFELKNLTTNFFMDTHSIIADKLSIKTSNSTIETIAKIHYTSLTELKDSIQNMIVFIDLKKSKIHTKDILYFNPQLIHQYFFQTASNSVTLSGKITGSIGNLQGENISITTASNTAVATAFTIRGLPNFETSYFDFPHLKLTTSKKDLLAIAGTAIFPKQINLPDNISIDGQFKGKIKSFESKLSLKTNFGDVDATVSIDKNENFIGYVQSTKFDLGQLLNDKKMYGPVAITVNTSGKGLDKKTINAKLKIDVPEFYLNQYTYQKLSVDGTISGQAFDGKVTLDDPNAAVGFKGLVNLDSGNTQYKFNLDLKGANLKKLNLTNDDFRIAFTAVSDLKGKDLNTINGKAGVTNILVVHNGNRYILDSLFFASINEKGKSKLDFSSALIGIKYNGTFAPGDLVNELKKHINSYFPIDSIKNDLSSGVPQNFDFEIQLHNHPILSEVFFPQLKEFDPGVIAGSFDSEKHNLSINASINKLVYGTTAINAMTFSANSDAKALNYNLTCAAISNAQIKFENFTIDGKLADNKANVNVTSIDADKNKKIAVQTELYYEKGNYKLTINPDTFYLANEQWKPSNDNYLLFGKDGFLIHHFALTKSQSEIAVASVNDKFNDDIHATIKNFKLEDLSRIIEKDTSLVQGTVEGDVQLKRVQNTYGIIADMAINNLVVKNVEVGNLKFNASNPTAEKFNINMSLLGAANDIKAQGYYLPTDSVNGISVDLTVKSLSAKTVEAFSMGQIREADGTMHGNFSIKGNPSLPAITGILSFDNVFMNPALINSRIQFQNQKIELNKDGFHLNSFTILDKNKNPAVINGAVNMEHFSNYNFALDITTKNFLLMNTKQKDNKEFYGTMFIDSKINVKGTPTLPIINSSIKLKDGSYFTFAVPETKLTTDKGENTVVFDDSLKLNPILTKNESTENHTSSLQNFDISSNIEIDKKATLRLLLDPGSSDSLVVRGDAALSFTLDPSGKTSLTGAYNLNDGSYLVSLENLVKKKFKIESGSTIVWDGDPLDAEININASYTIRASPIDLVAGQLSGLGETEKGEYQQRYPFIINLKLKGALLKPEISFEIQLPQEDKGVLGGAVNAKLNELNDDPSALNKQVFGLLVMNRFIQDDPLHSDANSGASAAARSTVGKFLSAQLNQLAANSIKGVELNFDVQSYDDYTSGSAQGRTEVGIGLKKELFNDRFSVQVGGTVDVEGEKAKQNSASEITGDVTMEYKLSKDGRYRLKGFRHNDYEEIVEGQIVETGAGVLYVRDFNKWKELFVGKGIKKQPIENKKNDTTIKK